MMAQYFRSMQQRKLNFVLLCSRMGLAVWLSEKITIAKLLLSLDTHKLLYNPQAFIHGVHDELDFDLPEQVKNMCIFHSSLLPYFCILNCL